MRALLLFPMLAACTNNVGIIEVGDSVDEEEASLYDGATLRIVSPASGSFLALEDAHDFEAVLVDSNGEPMDYQEVHWTSSAATDWARDGLTFSEEGLPVGLHDFTAEVALPNGDRLAHTVGGVLVQSEYAGTYAGMFAADITYDGYTVTCSGNALLVVDAYGELATGDATCLIAFNGYELEAVYLFDLENDEGELEGTASVDVGGFFEFPFDAEGSLDVDDTTLDIAFGGDMGGMAQIDATVDTTRISLDSGL